MNWQHVDIESALRRLADRRIEEAMADGKFDNLPGAGKPLNLEPMPADENARLAWWALRIMRQNDFTPHEVQYRKQVDALTAAIDAATDEARLPALVAQANELVRRVNTLGTNAISLPMVPIDLDAARARLRARAGQAADAAPPNRSDVGRA